MEDSRQCYEKTRPLPKATDASSDDEPVLPPLGILAGLSERSLKNLACYGKYESFPPGALIVREGASQDRFYVVVDGEVAVTARSGAKEATLSTARAGECLGEVNLLEPGPASASIRVIKEATVWSMDIIDLRVYLADHAGGAGAFLMGMASCLSARLRQANELIRKNHALPAETLPQGKERAITASNAPLQIGFFDRIKKKIGREKKIQISTKIKM
jgi:CRP/FNR family transcriptional regulator, cyclic AMP receptor protein